MGYEVLVPTTHFSISVAVSLAELVIGLQQRASREYQQQQPVEADQSYSDLGSLLCMG
jgi:hypothetical protein